MNREKFDKFCGGLKAATHVVQWGGASVWKVGGKIFAICARWGTGDHQKIGFKCSDLSFTLLCEHDGIVPAPYLARAKWVQLAAPDALPDADIRRYIEHAHSLVAAKLTKAKRTELGLYADEV